MEDGDAEKTGAEAEQEHCCRDGLCFFPLHDFCLGKQLVRCRTKRRLQLLSMLYSPRSAKEAKRSGISQLSAPSGSSIKKALEGSWYRR